MTTAKILADSINEDAVRLTTFEIEIPKYMVAQLNTHRALSRNYESSRAKPFWKVVEQVLLDPYFPERFGAYGPGMQPAGYLEGDEHYKALEGWLDARIDALNAAITVAYPDKEELNQMWRKSIEEQTGTAGMVRENQPKVAKELLNRILEPYMKVKGIISATEWDNFLALRGDSDSQDDINTLAKQISDLLVTNDPEFVEPGEWHLPFSDTGTVENVERIARVSYGNHNAKSKRPEGELYLQLADSGHWSPFEHVAQAGWDGKSNFDPTWIQLREIEQ